MDAGGDDAAAVVLPKGMPDQRGRQSVLTTLAAPPWNPHKMRAWILGLRR